MQNLFVVRIIINNVVIAVAAYMAGYYFTSMFHTLTAEIGGMWAVISGLIVVESTETRTLKSAKLRVVGSFIGVFVSGLYLYLFDFSIFGFAVCIGLGALICHILRIPGHIKLTGVTIAVVMIVSFVTKDSDPVMNATLRFAESVIGTVVAIAVAYFSPLKKHEENK